MTDKLCKKTSASMGLATLTPAGEQRPSVVDSSEIAETLRDHDDLYADR